MADRRALERSLLAEVGLGGLPDKDQASLFEAVTDEPELRVGTRLADANTEEQVAEFEILMSAGDDAAASHFLERTVPWRGTAVQEEIEHLRTLLGARAAEILQAVGGHE